MTNIYKYLQIFGTSTNIIEFLFALPFSKKSI